MGARRTLTVVALALAFTLALVLAGSGWQLVREGVDGVIEKDTSAPFYSVPASVPAATPGTLYRSAPIPSAPAGSRAWRVLYHSTDVLGHDILVSGVVIAPTAPAPTRAPSCRGAIPRPERQPGARPPWALRRSPPSRA